MSAVPDSPPMVASGCSPRTVSFVALSLFLITFSIYLATMSPSLSTQSDSGELVTAASVAGIAHPPGYPLYTMAGHLFTLVPVGDKAFRLNVMSGFFSSCAVVLTFLGALLLLGDVAAAAASALALAFSRIFWSLSLSAEVFSLHLFFVSLLFYLLLLMRHRAREGQQHGTHLSLFFFILGLSLSHHHTILFMFPAFFSLLVAWKLYDPLRSPKGAARAFALVCAGLLPYLYLPLRAACDPAANWGNPSTLSSFIQVVTRAGYGTFALAQLSAYSRSLQGQAAMALASLKLLVVQFNIAVVLCALPGAWMLWRKERPFLLVLLYMVLVSCPLFALLSGFPCHEGYLAILERFFLPASYACALLSGAGAFSLQSRMPVFLPARAPVWGMILVIAVTAALSFSPVSRRHNYVAADYGANLLKSLDEKAILFVQGDVAAGSLLYLQNVCGLRPDVTVIFEGLLRSSWYVDQLAARNEELSFIKGSDLLERRVTMQRLMEGVGAARPVYFNHPVDDSAVNVENRGLVYRAVKAGEPAGSQSCREIQELLDHAYGYRGSYDPKRADFFSRELLSLYCIAYYHQALRWKEAGDDERWLANARRALEFDPSMREALFTCGEAYMAGEAWDAAESIFRGMITRWGDKKDTWMNLAVVYARQGKSSAARDALRRAGASDAGH